MKVPGILILGLLFSLTASFANSQTRTNAEIIIDKNIVISSNFLGNGVQWDPYQLDYGKGRVEISESDWKKIYSRLDNMSPGFIRIMVNSSSLIHNGRIDMEKGYAGLKPLLDYCQSRSVDVMFGDWGGKMVYFKKNIVDSTNLRLLAEYTDFLVSNKGYSCIKYFNLINEPNGDWSVTYCSYPLWAKAMRYFHKQMQVSGLQEKVKMVGPDAAIWTESEAWWVDSCANHLNNIVKLYDIHTYPSKITVNSGEYSKIIRAYRKHVPSGSQIIMGEIGLKFVDKADSLYDKENKRRIEAKPHASKTDSQMFVYDHMYGTDMADALFQSMNEGYSGSVIWMLDDAMHSNESPGLLKIWGFWNILGEEYFGGAKEEEVRPFYYAWSLLCKYIPRGSSVYKVKINGNNNVRAIAIENNKKYTIAVVNTGEDALISIRSISEIDFKNVRQYNYIKGQINKQGDSKLLPNKSGLKIDFKLGIEIPLPKEGMIVFTNVE